MELRTLRYFLALVNEGTISKAAQSLDITQPTLSRQLCDLEKEFGKQLFTRGAKRIRLTEEGAMLREYAEEIMSLAEKAAIELSAPTHAVLGNVRIACGEGASSRSIFRAIKRMRDDHPHVQFHIFSGNSADLAGRFNSGLFDFFQEYESSGRIDCHSLDLPEYDSWGVVMPADAPLAKLDRIRPEDLEGKRVIESRQGMKVAGIREWAGSRFDTYEVAATYNLAFNGAAMAKEGIGYCLCYDGLIDVTEESGMCFKPLDPPLVSRSRLLWKKHRRLTRPAETFLEYLKKEIDVKSVC